MKWKLFTGLELFLFFGLCFALISGCTLPSPGHYKRVENKLESIRVASEKNKENTEALVKNQVKGAERKEWEKAVSGVNPFEQAPKDKNSGDWVETLLYILLGMSGLGGMAKGANFLYKLPPGKKS
jgi:hypothetical protein